MVFESILRPETAERKPVDAFILSFVLSTISIMLSLIVFTPYLGVNLVLALYILFFIGIMLYIVELPRTRARMLISLALLFFVTGFFLKNISVRIMALDYSPYATSVSLSMIFFTSLGLAPLMVRLLQVEERKDITDMKDSFLERHAEVLLAYAFLFLGAVIAYSLWFTILPEPLINAIFGEQIQTIRWVSELRSGLVISGFASAPTIGFRMIVENNLKILAVATLMSFALGSGAIFILTWNASVIAVAIGESARSLISYYASLGNFASVAAYFHALPLSASRLIFHGSIEIAAYFIGGLSGGILSVAALAHQGKAVWLVIKDASKLLAIAVIMIFVAALIESVILGL